MVFLVIYAAVTLLPFYFLLVRTFVATKDSTELWLWPPPAEEVNLDAQIGNLAVYLSLDLEKVREDLDIPTTDYLNPKLSLKKIGGMYGISEARLKSYFFPFVRYTGWTILLTNDQFWFSIARTLFVTLGGIVGVNLLSFLTGAALAGLRRRYQMWIYSLYLFQTVIPGMLILVPQFVMVQWLLRLIPGYESPGLTRHICQLLTIILMYSRGGAVAIMVYTSFIATIPRELEDSAAIDGASRWRYLLGILLPNMKVATASLTVIRLTTFWNDFLRPYVYLDSKNTTLLPLVQSFAGEYSTNFQVIYTGVLVSILPLAVVYLVFRRWFIRGVMAGAIKG